MNDNIDNMNETNDYENAATSGRREYPFYCESKSEWGMVRRELSESTEPLSADEEHKAFRDMVHAAIMGDNSRRRAIREKIFKANIRLAYSFAKKLVQRRWFAYGEYASSLLDLMHVAYNAIYKAIDKFNVDSGNRFSTYAFMAIRNEINMTDGIRARREIGVGPMKRLDMSICPEEETTWRELLEDSNSVPIPEMVCCREKAAKFQAQIRCLSKRERDLVSVKLGMAGDKIQLRDMARKYGISPQRASQIVSAAIDKLRRNIAA